MERDQLVRRALSTSAFFNVGGALLFAFPGSIGQLAGLPVPVPRLYSIFIAFLVLLFGGTYWWLARQPEVDRPLVAFAAIGKTGFFLVVTLCWLLGDVPGRAVAAGAGDLLFAGIFAWWVMGSGSRA